MCSAVRVLVASMATSPLMGMFQCSDDERKNGQGFTHAHFVGKHASAFLVELNGSAFFRHAVNEPS